MSEPFIGQINMFAGNFAPRGWAFSDGQLIAISQNEALFSLYGTIYGGDGRTTFGLPDLRGRIPMHAGHGAGLSERRLGSKLGNETVTLNTNQLASHQHDFHAANLPADQLSPETHLSAIPGVTAYDSTNTNASLNSQSISNTGGSRSHNNLMPALCIHYIVALFGIYPSRT